MHCVLLYSSDMANSKLFNIYILWLTFRRGRDGPSSDNRVKTSQRICVCHEMIHINFFVNNSKLVTFALCALYVIWAKYSMLCSTNSRTTDYAMWHDGNCCSKRGKAASQWRSPSTAADRSGLGATNPSRRPGKYWNGGRAHIVYHMNGTK